MSNSLAPEWLRLVETVIQEKRCLTAAVLESAVELFRQSYAFGQGSPGEITREYDKEEFLLVVDRDGRATGMGEDLLRSFRGAVFAHSQLGEWFQEGSLVVDQAAGVDITGEPVLLAARWLCHLVGLRHQTVEIFIDPPSRVGHTLVQVRGLDKVDSPGAFDLPCAGHISGTDGVIESLEKELGEELNLGLADLDDLQELVRYESDVRTDHERKFINIEFCYLFHARLRADGVGRVKFNDGEVAGLAVFEVGELEKLVGMFPERVAAGLKDSLPYYESPTFRTFG